MCYPEEGIRATEREASVLLQGLLLHTFRPIIKFCSGIISEYCRQKKKTKLIVLSRDPGGLTAAQDSLFTNKGFQKSKTKMKMKQHTFLYVYLQTSDRFVLWSNPSPQSFRYCRPLKIQYRAENKELIIEEKMRVEDEIKKIIPLYAETDEGQIVIVDSQLHLTIIDGKVFNVISGTTSQQRCACCGATSETEEERFCSCPI